MEDVLISCFKTNKQSFRDWCFRPNLFFFRGEGTRKEGVQDGVQQD